MLSLRSSFGVLAKRSPFNSNVGDFERLNGTSPGACHHIVRIMPMRLVPLVIYAVLPCSFMYASVPSQK
jgi:hypothetical protein